MSRSPVLFRVDADPEQGYEQVSRCHVFAAALQRRRRTAYFLSRLDPGSMILPLKRGGNEFMEAESPIGTKEDLEETLREIRRLSPAAVVVDSPNADEDYLSRLAKSAPLVVTLDHHAAHHFPSRLVVNPLLGPSREAYDHGDRTQLLLGERYALIRSEIRRLRPLRSQEPQTPFRVAVALSEHDPDGFTAEVVKLLLETPGVEKVDVVGRAHHRGLDTLRAMTEEGAGAGRLEIATEANEVGQKLVRCHAAITSGTAWSLELACIGVPQLLVVQDEAYWPTARRLEEEGAATCVGSMENLQPQNFKQAVVDLLADPLERQAMARCGRQLIDGRGPDRLILALEVLLHPYRQIQTFAEAA